MKKRSTWRSDLLLRLSVVLYTALANRRASRLQSSDLISQTRSLNRRLRLLDTASERGWPAAVRQISYLLRHQISELQQALAGVQEDLAQPPFPLSQATLHQELLALQRDFDGFEILNRPWRLAVETMPVELEGVALGRFRIELDFQRLIHEHRDQGLVSLTALDPNPAESDSQVTHPHVRSGELCLGDATLPLRRALSQGRLCDAFTLIDRVLNTYNDHSPYVALEDWQDGHCEECGRTVPSDEGCTCEGCDRQVCDHCRFTCNGCDRDFCRSCVEEDAEEQMLCSSCRGTCSQCDRMALQQDLQEHKGLCLGCWEASGSDNATTPIAITPVDGTPVDGTPILEESCQP